MAQLKIEKRQWRNYFDSLNKRHHSRLARLEVSDETGSYQTVNKCLFRALCLIKAELK